MISFTVGITPIKGKKKKSVRMLTPYFALHTISTSLDTLQIEKKKSFTHGRLSPHLLHLFSPNYLVVILVGLSPILRISEHANRVTFLLQSLNWLVFNISFLFYYNFPSSWASPITTILD